MNLKFFVILIFLFSSVILRAQDNSIPVRQPEQEAKIQTERMKQRIELTPEQEAKIYKINLRYAQERQLSNSRAEAMQRIKRKDEDFRRVLTVEQYRKMRNGQYNRTDSEITLEADTSVNFSSPKNKDLLPVQSLRSIEAKESKLEKELKESFPEDSLTEEFQVQEKDTSTIKIDIRTRTSPTRNRRQRFGSSNRLNGTERVRRTNPRRRPLQEEVESDSLLKAPEKKELLGEKENQTD